MSLKQKLDSLVKKRDHAADVLNKPALALSYQAEIDSLLEPPFAHPPALSEQFIQEALRLADAYESGLSKHKLKERAALEAYLRSKG